jgi:alpha-ribazole phosphatase
MTGLPVTTLFLIRHTEPAAWAKGLCHGALDVPLSEDGVIHARRIGDHLREMRIDVVYSSPLNRAAATASAVASPHGLEPMLRPDLKEINFGSFEGRTFDEIAVSHPDLYTQWMREPTSVRFPGGEGFADLRARATREIARIRREHEGGSVVVVTHGGVIRAVLSEVLGMHERFVFRIDQSWGGMSRVEWVGDEPTLRSSNQVV